MDGVSRVLSLYKQTQDEWVDKWNPPHVKLYFEGAEVPKGPDSHSERSIWPSVEIIARRYLCTTDPAADPAADLARLIAQVSPQHPILQVGPCLWVYRDGR